MAVGPITVTESRQTGVDFLHGFMEDGLGVMIRRPSSQPLGLFILLRPFDSSSWLAIAGTVALMSGVTWFTAYASPLSHWRRGRGTWSGEALLQEHVWGSIGSFLQQGDRSSLASGLQKPFAAIFRHGLLAHRGVFEDHSWHLVAGADSAVGLVHRRFRVLSVRED